MWQGGRWVPVGGAVGQHWGHDVGLTSSPWVADQLQTNFASDLRSILKTVFKIVASQAESSEEPSTSQDAPRVADCPLCSSPTEAAGLQRTGACRLPEWVPDSTCSQCSTCRSPFTLLRRRHHCRSCGKIFCARCSPHAAALPHYGQPKPVRVCTRGAGPFHHAEPPAPCTASHPGEGGGSATSQGPSGQGPGRRAPKRQQGHPA
uniref:FYVE-type domain-containing protein n=1 Tax=Buteo japonicus TaxID=224669 RepID=A0A8B9Z4P7_9AVES